MGEIIQTLTYGSYYDGDTDLVALGTESMTIFSKTCTGYIVDFLPILRHLPSWFPGAQFKRDAKVWKTVMQAAERQPFEMVKRQRAAGAMPRATFTSSLLDDNDAAGGNLADERWISEVAANLFAGGSHTSVATMLDFIMAMTLYPEVQAKAQAEIDRVVGKDRCPNIADKDSLPYLNAILMETMRWHPVIPTGLPHRLTQAQDNIYNGYHIPAGTLVIVNVWGILHDEHRFPDPHEFRPERYLPLCTGQIPDRMDPSTMPVDPRAAVFGYGRRICPGAHVGQMGLWIVMAIVLSSFDIRPKIDPETKKPLLPVQEWSGDVVSFAKQFSCEFRPRSKERAEWIKQAAADGL